MKLDNWNAFENAESEIDWGQSIIQQEGIGQIKKLDSLKTSNFEVGKKF